MSEVFDLVSATAAGFTALVFARAAWHKLSDFTAFTGFVADYGILPARLVDPAAIALAAAEVVAVAFLLIPGGQALGAAVAAALLALYAVAMALAMRNGKTSIECGCGGAPTQLAPALLVRNAVLVAIALLIPIGGPIALTFGEAVAAVGVAFILWTAFILVEQILANEMRARTMRTQR